MSNKAVPSSDDGEVIGVDIGGTKILSIRASATEILDREQVKSKADGPGILDQIESSIAALIDRSPNKPVAVGVGMAGFIGLDGVARSAPNTAGLVGVDIPGILGNRFGLPVRVDNDANCVAIAARDAFAGDSVASDSVAGDSDAVLAETMVAVTLGTGIGGGLVVGGELFRGANGFAGEPGHMVIDPNGPECPCGQFGCWERFASGSGLAWLATRAAEAGRADSVVNHAKSLEAIKGKDVSDLAAAGDPQAQEIFDEFAFYVALGIANLVVVFDPQMVVVGGGLAALGDQLLNPVRAALADHFPSATRNRETKIIMAPGGPDAGAWGAALLARQ
ncbi:MAG TPA: ROK family protein [Microthrixaceae bacterium]|nr:ROK family protein [Microthrixaceae bacterium]